MSAKARFATAQAVVLPFSWQSTGVGVTPAGALVTPPSTTSVTAAAHPDGRLAAIERDAFAQGFAQGERAGAEASAVQAAAMLRRMAQTIEEIAGLRRRIARDTEHQMVQLAL